MADKQSKQLSDVTVEVVTTKKSTRINIVREGRFLCLSFEKTNSKNYLQYVVVSRYIVAYLTYEKDAEKLVRVTGLYDRKEKKIIQVNKFNRDIILYTLLFKKSFYLSTVLEYLNYGRIEAATEDECNEFENFITSGREIPRSEIEVWIFKAYPVLKKYIGIKQPMKIETYLAVSHEIGSDDLYFHAMPNVF